MDRASGWVSVCCFNKIGVTTKEIIPYIRKVFVEFGIQEKFESNQGPQFSSNEFQWQLTTRGIEITVFLILIVRRPILILLQLLSESLLQQ